MYRLLPEPQMKSRKKINLFSLKKQNPRLGSFSPCSYLQQQQNIKSSWLYSANNQGPEQFNQLPLSNLALKSAWERLHIRYTALEKMYEHVYLITKGFSIPICSFFQVLYLYFKSNIKT